MNKGYLYIRTNEWCDLKEVYKVGITKSIKDRNNTYITGEIIKGNFIKIFELDVNKNQLNYIDKIIKIYFKKLNVYINAGTEFYKREIMDKIEEYLNKSRIKFKLVNEDELNRINRKNDIINKYLKFFNQIIKNNDNDNDNDNELRDYQKEAISYLTNEIKLNNRCYLYLATGAGKSLIAINVISNIQPLIVVIFSPRITIKIQNINKKYLKILKNYSIGINKNNYMIYSYCYQSYKNVYNMIKNNDINNILIWFDEAHWALDNWVKDIDNEIKQFFINDNIYIKYRLMTTASPDKDFINNNEKKY